MPVVPLPKTFGRLKAHGRHRIGEVRFERREQGAIVGQILEVLIEEPRGAPARASVRGAEGGGKLRFAGLTGFGAADQHLPQRERRTALN